MPIGNRVVRHARSVARLTVLSGATAAIYAVFLVGAALSFWSPKLAQRWRYGVFRAWARTVAAIAGMDLRVEGAVPRQSFLLVSNHLSYVDIIAYSCVLGCTYVAKSDLASWPVVGMLCKSMRVIFIDRARRADVVRVGTLVEDAISAGEGVVIFPEGTSTMGDDVAPFKPSLLDFPARTGLPVQFAAVSYAVPAGEPPAHMSICWWGDMTFGKHLYELFQLSGFTATIRFGGEPVLDSDRKSLAEALHAGVRGEFEPVVRTHD